MNSGSCAATKRAADAATARTSSVRRAPERASSCGIAARRPPRASAAIVGLSSETCELGQAVQRALDRPETAQRLERGQRDQQLGLVERVLERARRVVPRNPGGLLGGEPGLRLLARRMRLQGQRLLGGEHLHQERQPGTEPFDHPAAQERVGIGVDRHVQRTPVGQPARLVGVRPDPELRVRPLGRDGMPEELGDHGPATPRVVADAVAELPHRSGRLRRALRTRNVRGLRRLPESLGGGRSAGQTAARTSGAPCRAASAVWSSGMRCDSRSAATRAA